MIHPAPRRFLACAAVALAMAASYASAAQPSQESIVTLLTLTRSEQLIEKSRADMEKYMRSGVAMGLGGRQPSEREQQIIDKMVRDSVAVMREALDWPSMRDFMAGLYAQHFSQEEVDGLIAFYRSPAGEALVNKMPLVMDASVANIQRTMVGIAPRLQAISAQAQKELRKAAGAKPSTKPQE